MNVKTITALMALLMAFNTSSPAQEQTTITIKGSNTFGEKLGPALVEAFQKRNRNIDIHIESEGSGTGISAMLDGETIIASSSRVMSEDELRLAQARNIQVQQYIVGYYGIAVIVNANNTIRSLTDREVEAIFTGAISNWKDVGGDNKPINIYIPNALAGTYLGFRELAMRNNPYATTAREVGSYPEIVAAIAADANGIGYASMNLMHGAGVRGMLINGIPPGSMAVIEGLYPYARMVRLFANPDKLPRSARRFIRFMQSNDGQHVVESTGFVPRYATKVDFGGFGP